MARGDGRVAGWGEGLQNYRHLKMTVPIPAEYDDTDTDTDINAGRRKSYSFDRQHAENSDVLLSHKPLGLGPAWLAGFAASVDILCR